MADYGHSKTDEMLKDLESRIYEEYSGASKEIQKQTSKYLEKFKTKDAEMLKKLNANEITHKEYLTWRESAMTTGKRWEALKDTIDKDLENANQIANAMIRDHTYDVYALNHNYGTYEIENGLQANTSYTLYNHSTVERLVRDNPQMLPPPGKVTSEKIRRGELKRWNNRQVQSVMTQSILAGDSIPEISKKLATRMGEVSAYSHIRAARTMTTGAQNAGRIDSYTRAEALGLKVKKQWLAAHDSRVRRSHRELDGTSVPLNEEFDNECSYPGDPLGPAAEVYNCRCTLIADFGDDPELGGDFELGDMDFEEWIEAHEESDTIRLQDIGPEPTRPAREYDENGFLTDAYYQKSDAYREARSEWEGTRDAWIRQELPSKSMTVEEFGSWCKANDVVIYNDISAVDGRMLTAYSERMDKLFNDFPEVKWHKREIDYAKWGLVPDEINLHYQVLFEDTMDYMAEATHGMTFGHTFTNAENALRDKFDLTKNGYLTNGDGTINQIFDHEFGHNVKDWMEVRNGGMTTRQRVDFEDDILKSLSGKKGASEYSTTNADELFAEGFSAWYGGERTEFANAMGDLLRRYKVI